MWLCSRSEVPSDRRRQLSLLFYLQHPVSIIKGKVLPNHACCFLIKSSEVFLLFLTSITFSFVCKLVFFLAQGRGHHQIASSNHQIVTEIDQMKNKNYACINIKYQYFFFVKCLYFLIIFEIKNHCEKDVRLKEDR